MLRVVEDLVGRALLDDLAEVHKDDVVGDAESLTESVSHHDDTIVLLEFDEEFLDLLAGDRVEGACRLVGEEVGRFDGETACEA